MTAPAHWNSSVELVGWRRSSSAAAGFSGLAAACLASRIAGFAAGSGLAIAAAGSGSTGFRSAWLGTRVAVGFRGRRRCFATCARGFGSGGVLVRGGLRRGRVAVLLRTGATVAVGRGAVTVAVRAIAATPGAV